MSLPDKFVALDHAVERFSLRHGALKEVCVYPGRNTLTALGIDSTGDILAQGDTDRAVSAICGSTGVGKTFALLAGGWRWLGNNPEGFVWYGQLRALSRDIVVTQFEQYRQFHCVWLLDEVDDSEEEKLLDLIKCFKDLSTPDHRLRLAGLHLPKGAGIPVIQVRLTKELAKFALATKGLPSPADDQLKPVLPLGLRWIIFIAQRQPDFANVERFLDTWEDALYQQYPEWRSLILFLAYCKLIGLSLPAPSDLKIAEGLGKLASKGLVEEPHMDSWQLSDDSIAQALTDLELRRQLPNTPQRFKHGAADLFVREFVGLSEELRYLRDTRFLGRLLALSKRVQISTTSARLCRGAEAVPDSVTLATALTANDTFPISARNTIRAASTPFRIAAGLLRQLGNEIDWVQRSAAELIEENDDRIRSVLKTGPIPEWTAVEWLATLSGETSLRTELLTSLSNPAVIHAVVQLPMTQRNEFLLHIKEKYGIAFERLIDQILPELEGEMRLAKGSTLWSSLRLFGTSADRAIRVMRMVGDAVVAEVTLRQPKEARHAARSFFGTTTRRIKYSGVRSHWRTLMREVFVESRHVEHWGVYDLEALVELSALLEAPHLRWGSDVESAVQAAIVKENPALVFGLAKAIALASRRDREDPLRTFFAAEILQTVRRQLTPVNERIYAARLVGDRSSVEQVVNIVLETRPLERSESRAEFWLLYNCLYALHDRYRGCLFQRAHRIFDEATTWNQTDHKVATLSLMGICAHLIKERSPSLEICESLLEKAPLIPTISPISLIFVLRALSSQTRRTEVENRWLKILTDFLANPDQIIPPRNMNIEGGPATEVIYAFPVESFSKRYGKALSPMHQILIEALTDSVAYLSSGGLAEFSTLSAALLGQECDFYWSKVPWLRIEFASRYACEGTSILLAEAYVRSYKERPRSLSDSRKMAEAIRRFLPRASDLADQLFASKSFSPKRPAT